ncbi:MAG: hypothetical protein HY553_18680, partial [Elusimicrobia bacterium]|nr:hypothetical protein [Elusimicrobiota bacterium]
MKPFELDAAAIQRVDRAATGGYLDERAVSAMRCVLALSAPLVMLIDGAPPTRLTVLAFGSLLGYCAYCVFLFIAALRGKAFIASRAQPWVDILAYAWLAALSSGTNSIFFYFFFFPVVVASFSRGLREGVAATLASVLLFALIGFATSPEILQSDLQEALARPLYLLLLGCMLAYWGGHEKALRRRIRMLEEVGTVANPRLGVEHAMTQNLRRLLAIFHADACVVVCAKPGSADYLMYRVAASPENAAVAPRVLTAQSAQALLELPPAVSVVWNPGRPQHDG